MTDPWIARIGLLCLGLVALGSVIGSTWLVETGHEIPPTLAGIGTSASSTLGVVVIALIRVGNGKYPSSASGHPN